MLTPMRLTGASVMCRPSYLAIAAKSFFIHHRQTAARHAAAAEPSQAGRRGSGPWDMWWHHSPPQRGGGIRSCGTRGGTGALLSRDDRVRYHWTCGSAWSHTLLLGLSWSLHVGVPGLQGVDNGPWAHLKRGGKPTGGANISFPCTTLLEYALDRCSGSVVLPVVRCPLRIGTSCRSVQLGR
jgi:hypothetical protein